MNNFMKSKSMGLKVKLCGDLMPACLEAAVEESKPKELLAQLNRCLEVALSGISSLHDDKGDPAPMKVWDFVQDAKGVLEKIGSSDLKQLWTNWTKSPEDMECFILLAFAFCATADYFEALKRLSKMHPICRGETHADYVRRLHPSVVAAASSRYF